MLRRLTFSSDTQVSRVLVAHLVRKTFFSVSFTIKTEMDASAQPSQTLIFVYGLHKIIDAIILCRLGRL